MKEKRNKNRSKERSDKGRYLQKAAMGEKIKGDKRRDERNKEKGRQYRDNLYRGEEVRKEVGQKERKGREGEIKGWEEKRLRLNK